MLEHLFIQCDYAAKVWNALLGWLNIPRTTLSWTCELLKMSKVDKEKHISSG